MQCNGAPMVWLSVDLIAATHLAGLLKDRGPGFSSMHSPETKARPTVKDVASYAGVSTATVSRVINRGENVSSDIRSRVLSAVASLNYSPNPVAAQLSRNGGQPRRRAITIQQRSVGLKQSYASHRESHAQKGEEALKLENKELKRTIKNLMREVSRWKTRAQSQTR